MAQRKKSRKTARRRSFPVLTGGPFRGSSFHNFYDKGKPVRAARDTICRPKTRSLNMDGTFPFLGGNVSFQNEICKCTGALLASDRGDFREDRFMRGAPSLFAIFVLLLFAFKPRP